MAPNACSAVVHVAAHPIPTPPTLSFFLSFFALPQVIQTLPNGHTDMITQLAFQSCSPAARPGIRIVSGDASGRLLLWDVVAGKQIVELSDPKTKTSSGKAVVALSWLPSENGFGGREGLILSLHSGSPLSMWNANNGALIWTVTLPEALDGFSLDPFVRNRLCLFTSESLIIVDDFSLAKAPENLKNKFNVTAGPNSSARGKSSSSKMMPKEQTLRVVFSKYSRNHLYLMFPKEILVMDLAINQTIASLALERGGSPFQTLIPCTRKNFVYCLHQNGSISTRGQSTGTVSARGAFEVFAQSESIRLAKSSRILGIALNPLDETGLSLMTSDGRVLFYRYGSFEVSIDRALPRTQATHRRSSHFVLQNVIESSSSFPLCSLMCPEQLWGGFGQATSSTYGYGGRSDYGIGGYSLEDDKKLLAVGTVSGHLHIFDMETCSLEQKFYVNNGSGVKGLDWAGRNQVICFGSDDAGSAQALFTNSVVRVDLRSGVVETIREKNDSSPLIGVKVSLLEQYALLIFGDQPLELWDMNTSSLLKTMPEAFPTVAGLMWSVSSLKKGSPVRPSKRASPRRSPGPFGVGGGAGGLDEDHAKVANIKEHFVVSSHDGHLFHFSVEGSIVRHGARIPADPVMATVTCLAWKDDWIVTGDAGGGLHIWDLKSRVSRSIGTTNGAVKQIEFAPLPGSTQFLVLFVEGVSIWDASTASVLDEWDPERAFGSSKEPTAQVASVAWVSADRPLLVMADGSINVYDEQLTEATSQISDYNLKAGLQLCNAFDAKTSTAAKALLQHQPKRAKVIQTKAAAAALIATAAYDATRRNSNIPTTPARPISRSSAHSPDHTHGGGGSNGGGGATHDTTSGAASSDAARLQRLLGNIPNMFLTPMADASTIAGRCLISAQLYGDDYELKFWTIFDHYMAMNKSMQEAMPGGPGRAQSSPMAGSNASSGSKMPIDVRELGLPELGMQAGGGGSAASMAAAALASANAAGFGGGVAADAAVPKDERLPACFGVLCDADELRLQQLDSLAVHTSRKLDGKDARHITERHVLLGQHAQAVQMLLETDAKDETFYADSLRACVIAAVRTPATAQNTIKLVAMNLIAAGKLDAGVELLCLVGCHLDACYYLQSEGLWQRAALLAKATLHYAAYSEVLSRWVEHLASSSLNAEAVLVCLTFGRWLKALELLYELKWPSLTALFAEACIENELLNPQSSDPTVSARLEMVWTRASEWAKKSLGDESIAKQYDALAKAAAAAATAAIAARNAAAKVTAIAEAKEAAQEAARVAENEAEA